MTLVFVSCQYISKDCIKVVTKYFQFTNWQTEAQRDLVCTKLVVASKTLIF